MMINHAPHLVWSICKRRYAGHKFSVTTCHLFAVGIVARARDVAGVDGVANDDVEAFFGRGGAEAHRVAGVDVGGGGARGEECVFFDAERAEGVEVAAIPAEMRVGVAEAGEEGAVAALELFSMEALGSER